MQEKATDALGRPAVGIIGPDKLDGTLLLDPQTGEVLGGVGDGTKSAAVTTIVNHMGERPHTS